MNLFVRHYFHYIITFVVFFHSLTHSVIDDENTNVVTAGAIVTVTVTLVRSNLKELFGNADVAEKPGIK